MSLPISGFMPIPLAIMPPFMAYQSLVMGDAFGRAFQFGKRKISAMSNEEFNKLDVVTMFESISNEYTRMIPTVEKSMAASTDLQVAIVKEMLKVLPALGKELLKMVTGGDTGSEAFKHLQHGHPGLHKEDPTSPIITKPKGPQQVEVILEEEVKIVDKPIKVVDTERKKRDSALAGYRAQIEIWSNTIRKLKIERGKEIRVPLQKKLEYDISQVQKKVKSVLLTILKLSQEYYKLYGVYG